MKVSHAPKYIKSYTPPNQSVREKYLSDLSSNLIKTHGSKPSLVLGYNPDIIREQKDSDGVSLQVKGLINDLNYQLRVTGFKDPKGIVLPFCDLTDVDIGVLVQTLKHFAFDLTIIDLSYNRLQNSSVENLFYTMGTHQTPAKYVKNINLSHNFIGDYGAEYIALSIKSGRYPNLKLLNIGSNQITPEGFQRMSDILGQVAQEIFIITEESHEDGKAVFKDTSGEFYDMVITSDGHETFVGFADSVSGVSAGDTYPASVKDQIESCVVGAVGGSVRGWAKCGGSGKSKLVCIAKDAYIGCTIGATVAILKPYTSYGEEHKDNDRGGFGFSATGVTEIRGTTIDNDNGLSGSSFDLSQHDF